jgi:hypothetical protein
MTAGEFSTPSMEVLWPTRVLMLLIPYLHSGGDQEMLNCDRGLDSPNHGRSLQAQSPSMDSDVFGETHWLQHFWTEHATIPDFDPFVQHRMEGKNLQRGLSAKDRLISSS